MTEYVGEYKYVLLFIGLLAAGEAVLLPAIYFSFLGNLELFRVVVLALIATVLSDFFWHLLGKFAGNTDWFLRRFALQRKEKGFSEYFFRHRLSALFLSKFTYGTRILAQVMSGFYKIKFRDYFAVNIAATVVWIVCLVGLGAGASIGINERSSTYRVAEQFLAFLMLGLVLLFLTKYLLEKKWFQ